MQIEIDGQTVGLQPVINAPRDTAYLINWAGAGRELLLLRQERNDETLDFHTLSDEDFLRVFEGNAIKIESINPGRKR